MKIEPMASNRVTIIIEQYYGEGTFKLDISEGGDGRATIQISKNAKWNIDETFKELGDSNHINIVIMENKDK